MEFDGGRCAFGRSITLDSRKILPIKQFGVSLFGIADGVSVDDCGGWVVMRDGWVNFVECQTTLLSQRDTMFIARCSHTIHTTSEGSKRRLGGHLFSINVQSRCD